LNVVLDADVLIGALDGSDPHHRDARRLFSRWHRESTTRVISVVNLTEVLVEPAGDRAQLRVAREAIGALDIAIHRPGEAVAVDAARLRRTHPISLADAYCLATARHTDARVVSFDRKVVRAAEAEGLATR
jgi:predicted nucleic acid-binding protein